MKLRKKSWLAGVLLAAAIGNLPAAAQVAVNADPTEWAKVVAAAKKEGFVRFYSSQAPAVLERLAAGFRKAYPEIKVEFLHIAGGPALAKIDQEREGGLDGADVAPNSALGWYLGHAKAGRLLPMGPAAVGWPKEWTGVLNVPAVALYPWTIVYNTDLVKEPPKSYAELLEPKFRDRKLATTPPVGANSAMLYDFLNRQIPDFLPKLRAQNPRLYEGGDSNAQAVAAGEVWVSMWGDPSGVVPLKEAGAPINWAMPKPGISGQTFIAGFTWSKRPNAARLFVDYVMSRDGQVAWHGFDTTSASPRFNDIPKSISREGMVMVDNTKYTPETIRKIREEFLTYFRK